MSSLSKSYWLLSKLYESLDATFCLELHTAPDTTASQAGQKRRKGVSSPATGANTIPLNTADKQQPTLSQPQSSSSETADTLHDVSLIDDLAETYTADPFFADEAKTADLTFASGLWWKRDRIVVPDSLDTKRLILQAFHDHPMAGRLGVTKTLKAINSRFYWLHADREKGYSSWLQRLGNSHWLHNNDTSVTMMLNMSMLYLLSMMKFCCLHQV